METRGSRIKQRRVELGITQPTVAKFISQAVKPRHLWRGYKAALACEPVLHNTAVYISSVITQSRQL